MVSVKEEIQANRCPKDGVLSLLKGGKTSFRIPITPGLDLSSFSIQLYLQRCIPTECMDIEVLTDLGVKGRITLSTQHIGHGAPLNISFDEDLRYEEYVDLVFRVQNDFDGRIGLKVYIEEGELMPIWELNGILTTWYSDFKYEPLISIICPTYNTDLDLFKKTVNSVLDQSYYNYELCIVDDKSTSKELISYIKNLRKNKRVRAILLNENLGISGASNIGLGMVQGDYICFLDHDDLLDKNALFYMVKELQVEDRPDIIYSDEDKVNSNGTFEEPHYKPDWNYHLLLTNMYVCHLTLYSRDIVNKVGDLDTGLDGAQDYDFLLRCVEHTNKIAHVPKILYHWRKVEGSTSVSIRNKPSARISSIRAIDNHLRRIGKEGFASAGIAPGTYRVNYELDEFPSVAIIIPFKDQVQLLKNLLDTLKITDYPNYRVVLINNQSTEKETFEYLDLIEDDVEVIQYDKTFNFADMNNTAAYRLSEEYLLFLNNDIEIMHPEWLDNMVQQAVQENVAAVGAKLLYADHTIQHAGVVIDMLHIAAHGHKGIYDGHPGYFSKPHLTQEVSAVTGACMLVKRESFKKVGGFDINFPGAFNDIDLCLKFRANNELIIYTPYARLYHMESLSRGKDNHMKPEFLEAIKLMEKKWGCPEYGDPYFNPNLSLTDTYYTEKK